MSLPVRMTKNLRTRIIIPREQTKIARTATKVSEMQVATKTTPRMSKTSTITQAKMVVVRPKTIASETLMKTSRRTTMSLPVRMTKNLRTRT